MLEKGTDLYLLWMLGYKQLTFITFKNAEFEHPYQLPGRPGDHAQPPRPVQRSV